MPPKPPRAHLLDEAKRIITSDRNNAYGPPTQDFTRTAGMLTAMFSHKLREDEQFTGSDIARIMICLKLSRSMWSDKADNWLDMGGYTGCGYECAVDEGMAPL